MVLIRVKIVVKGASKPVNEKIKTKKQLDKNITLKGYKESKKKHKNRISMKLPNMENVNSEFRKKDKNLLTEIKEIFVGNGKLKDCK